MLTTIHQCLSCLIFFPLALGFLLLFTPSVVFKWPPHRVISSFQVVFYLAVPPRSPSLGLYTPSEEKQKQQQLLSFCCWTSAFAGGCRASQTYLSSHSHVKVVLLLASLPCHCWGKGSNGRGFSQAACFCTISNFIKLITVFFYRNNQEWFTKKLEQTTV